MGRLNEEMKVLLITNYFPPEIGAASHLFYDLAKELTNKGHQITIVTGFPRYNIDELDRKYKGKLLCKESTENIEIVRVAIIPFLKRSLFIRKIEYFFLPLGLLIGSFFAGRQDIAILYSPPVTIGLASILLKKIKKLPFIFNVQDIHPQALIDLGFLRNKLLIWMLKTVEKWIYKEAGFITVHSESNKKFLAEYGASLEKLYVIPNWTDTDYIKPLPKNNEFRKMYNFNKSFVVSFAGNMGTSQDMQIIIKAAEKLRSYEKINFFLVGNGVERSGAEEEVAKKDLKNVVFAPMQPRKKYPLVLAASDISLITLKKEVVTPVVPSKLLSIMASGRPVIASLNLNGDVPGIINEAKCGIVVSPDDPERLVEAILKLYQNPKLCDEMGINGRKYVEENFSIKSCVSMYEDLAEQLLAK